MMITIITPISITTTVMGMDTGMGMDMDMGADKVGANSWLTALVTAVSRVRSYINALLVPADRFISRFSPRIQGLLAVAANTFILLTTARVEFWLGGADPNATVWADIFHNVSDAVVSLMLLFSVIHASPLMQRITSYAMVGAIWSSVGFAGYATVHAMIHPATSGLLHTVSAGGDSMVGNRLAALILWYFGRRIQSSALTDAGEHAFSDTKAGIGVVLTGLASVLPSYVALAVTATVGILIISWIAQSAGEIIEKLHPNLIGRVLGWLRDSMSQILGWLRDPDDWRATQPVPRHVERTGRPVTRGPKEIHH